MEHEFHEEITQGEVKPDNIVCLNCMKEVPKRTVCTNCGYPLYLDETETPKTEESEGVIYEEIFGQNDSEELGEISIKSGFPRTAQGSMLINHEPVKRENAIHVVDDREESKNSKSFFSSMRKFIGIGGGLTTKEEKIAEDVDPIDLDEGNTSLVGDENEEVARQVIGMQDDETPEEVGDTLDAIRLEDVDIPVRYEAQEIPDAVENIMIPSSELTPTPIDEADPRLKKVQEGLLQSISLKLWLVNMLKEGGVDDDQFNRMFDEYEAQSSYYMKCRDEALETAGEIDSLVKRLGEAKVYLEEIKVKRAIGRVSEDEYEAKAPAFEWDIKHYQNEISKRKKKVEFMEDLTLVMPRDEIIEMKAKLENYRWAMDNLELSGDVTAETNKRIKESLERTMDFLESFKTSD